MGADDAEKSHPSRASWICAGLAAACALLYGASLFMPSLPAGTRALRHLLGIIGPLDLAVAGMIGCLWLMKPKPCHGAFFNTGVAVVLAAFHGHFSLYILMGLNAADCSQLFHIAVADYGGGYIGCAIALAAVSALGGSMAAADAAMKAGIAAGFLIAACQIPAEWRKERKEKARRASPRLPMPATQPGRDSEKRREQGRREARSSTGGSNNDSLGREKNMGYCTKCGAEIADDAKFCPECGASAHGMPAQGAGEDAGANVVSTPLQSTRAAAQATAVEKGKGSIGWAVLGFLIPVVGLILYLVWKDDKPGDALMAGKGALVSVIIGAVIMVLSMLGSCAAMGLFMAGV